MTVGVPRPGEVLFVITIFFGLFPGLRIVRYRVHIYKCICSSRRAQLRRDVAENIRRVHHLGKRLHRPALHIHATRCFRRCADFGRVWFGAAAAIHTARIWVEQVLLAHPYPVVVFHHLRTEEPLDRLERCLTFENFHRERAVIYNQPLLAAPEKLRAVRRRRTHAARHGETAVFKQRKVFQRDVRKNILPVNRVITLELRLLVGVPPFDRLTSVAVGRLVRRVEIALPFRKWNGPAICNGRSPRQKSQPFPTERVFTVVKNIVPLALRTHTRAR